MATKTCKVSKPNVPLDVTAGERLWIKVSGNVTGGAFSIRELPDGKTTGNKVLNFEDAVTSPYETIWPWPDENPAPGRHIFSFAASFFLATKYRLQVTKLRGDGSKEVVKDCDYEREKDNDKDSKFDTFRVTVS